MTEIGQSHLRGEAVEIALWEMPSPRLDAAMTSALAQFDSKNQEQVVGNVDVGDGSGLPDLGPLSSFGSWENVASTVLFKTAALSGFNPGSLDYDPVAWNKFLQRFSTIPFFATYTVDRRSASISPLALDKIVDAVSDLVQNFMTPQNFEDVKTAVKKMAALATRTEGQPEKDSNQQLGLLSRNVGKLYLGAVRTTVAMRYKQGKGYEAPPQTLDIYRGFGVLDFDKCIRHANTLLTWGTQVNAWVRNTNSYAVSPNDSPAWTPEPSLDTSSRVAV
ncbi:hypothetical protein F4560_002823 [Saccharothrix ecbatanensis]|uniref:Uncharacterized protein n=1 Tax=Saccharothrix ecbatanensis TaxID=1105145 RepID=A0A7W9HIY3_9PSEU|nr:hypothetical protein [Saccharothrix ecbatanensis]MBB5803055.1 hypothetical protein [Saccharothrix ecbatanensis]